MHDLATRIRQVSLISAKPTWQVEHKIWPIQHGEIYDNEDYLNSLHFPLEMGDIFEKDGGKKFILIAPPCDLMVRSSGMRSDGIDYATLVQISCAAATSDEVGRASDDAEEKSIEWELPYFDRIQRCFVKFRTALSVRLFGLDLCVLNADGRLTLSLDAEPDALLIPSWAKRFQWLRANVTKIVEAYRAAEVVKSPTKGTELQAEVAEENVAEGAESQARATKNGAEQAKSQTEAEKSQKAAAKSKKEFVLAAHARIDPLGLFAPLVQKNPDKLSYNLKRIGRLTQPRASALLAAYARFLTRPAFDHDLEKQRTRSTISSQAR